MCSSLFHKKLEKSKAISNILFARIRVSLLFHQGYLLSVDSNKVVGMLPRRWCSTHVPERRSKQPLLGVLYGRGDVRDWKACVRSNFRPVCTSNTRDHKT